MVPGWEVKFSPTHLLRRIIHPTSSLSVEPTEGGRAFTACNYFRLSLMPSLSKGYVQQLRPERGANRRGARGQRLCLGQLLPLDARPSWKAATGKRFSRSHSVVDDTPASCWAGCSVKDGSSSHKPDPKGRKQHPFDLWRSPASSCGGLLLDPEGPPR